jgi:hypothetical protein
MQPDYHVRQGSANSCRTQMANGRQPCSKTCRSRDAARTFELGQDTTYNGNRNRQMRFP